MVDDSGLGSGDGGNGPVEIDSLVETRVAGNIVLFRVELAQPCGSAAMILDAGIGSTEQKPRRDGAVGSINDRPPDLHPDLLADVLGKMEVATNRDGAAVGTLELLHKGENDVVAQDTMSFSGGTGYNGGRGRDFEVPAPNGTYFINLVLTVAEPGKNFNPRSQVTVPTTGIEDLVKLPAKYEGILGMIRARLNPSPENIGNPLFDRIYRTQSMVRC